MTVLSVNESVAGYLILENKYYLNLGRSSNIIAVENFNILPSSREIIQTPPQKKSRSPHQN